ncbi:MAG: hypothetical protein ACPGN3_05855 [Opitutales bacterium]
MPKQTPPSKPSEKPKRRSKRRARGYGEPSAIDIIEESIHVLRRLSWDAWLIYAVGMSVFVFALLYFWIEMGASIHADTVHVPGAFLCAAAFIFFRVCQARMIDILQKQHAELEPSAWSFSDWRECVRRQFAWQGLGAWVLPIVFVVTLPFPRVFAFFQSILCLGCRRSEDVDLKKEWEVARIWPEQNWMILTLLSVVWLCVFFNLFSLILTIPYLLDVLLGIETEFSRAGFYVLNSVTLFTCALVAYLITDPVTKAAYFLRRHYAMSQSTGEDLVLGLQKSTRRSVSTVSGGAMGLLAVVLGFLAMSPSLEAQEGGSGADNAGAQRVLELDRLVDNTLERREFSWRFPREEFDEGQKTAVSFLQQFVDWIDRIEEKIERFFDEMFDGRKQEDEPDPRGFFDGSSGFFDLMLFFLILVAVLVLVYFLGKTWRQNRVADEVALVEEAEDASAVNLEDENVSADQLPRNRWLEMARDLIAKGELRLALRAYFLAQLAELSSEGVIIIKKGKSNREYAYEIAKKSHAYAGLKELYGAEMRLFESVWYGRKPVGRAQIDEMESLLREQGVLS